MWKAMCPPLESSLGKIILDAKFWESQREMWLEACQSITEPSDFQIMIQAAGNLLQKHIRPCQGPDRYRLYV